MTRKPLSPRQRELYDHIVASALLGSVPTLREMCEHMGIRSTNGVNDHLHALERKGWIVGAEGKARGITVVGLWPDALAPFESARVYTFEDHVTARRWAGALGDEFDFRLMGAVVTVTRSKR